MIIVLVFALLALLLLLRMPIAFAMGVSGLVGMTLLIGPLPALSILDHTVYEHTSSFILVSIPLFILMAELMSAGRMTQRTLASCQAWLGHFRAGIAIATIGAAVLLAALIGSSTASTATMASSAYPEMKRHGYADRLSAALVSVGGTIAILIPPSIVLIIYGVLTETSIGKLFIAGILPGILTALGFVVTVLILVRKPGMAPPGDPFSLSVAVRESRALWPIMLLLVIVISAIYTGFASPTEAGAVGATGALVILAAQRSISLRGIWRSLSASTRITVMIIAIVFCSAIFSNFLVMTRVTQNLITAAETSAIPPFLIVVLFLVLLILLGMVLDQLAILSLTMPLVFPVVMSLGYDPVWFGIVVTKTVEIGLLTPPLGLNAYITSSQTGVPLKTVFRGVSPFLLTELVILSILVCVPQITLWLPGHMH